MTGIGVVSAADSNRLKVLCLVMVVSLPIDQSTLLGGHGILPPNSLSWLAALSGLGVIATILRTVPRSMASLVAGATPWFLLVPVLGVAIAPRSFEVASSLALASLYLIVAVATALLAATLGMRRLLAWFVAGLAIQLVIGIPVELFGPVDPVALEISTDSGLVGLGRFRGTFAHPNDLGRAAALVVLTSMIARPRGHRVFVGLGMLMLVLSQSRTATAALVVSLAFLAWPRLALHRRRAVAATTGTVFLVAAVLFVAFPSVGRVVERNDNPGELATLTGRTAIWAASVDVILDAPALGVGFSGAEPALDKAYRRGTLDQPTQHAHNGLLHVALIAGIPAALFLVVGGLLLQRQLRAGALAPLGVFVLVASTTEPLFGVDGGWLEMFLLALAGSYLWEIAPRALHSMRPGSYAVVSS